MDPGTDEFADRALRFSRNPLGIIALFIVLIYGLAALVTTFASSLSSGERLPLIYFLIIFPVLILGVFAWLVSRHSNKLFAPSDFKDESNYVKVLSATASLAVASAQKDQNPSADDIRTIVSAVRESTRTTGQIAEAPYWRHHLLWVDDNPQFNTYERSAFEAIGLDVSISLSTDDALEKLESQRFAAIISDMGRREGPKEGYVLLDALRRHGNQTPFFIYTSSNALDHKLETLERGGQGCTAEAQDLFRMVMRAVVSR
ncbi:response regulator [Actinoallomurus liliacearum]|uniref:response regulator n=1 Tax=Actinoallomurus liliacearum TaxID=1080073 RepID=UPI0031E716B5